MSPGRCAFPSGIFSTKPTAPITFTLAFLRPSVYIKPATTPAPPISHFISSMPPEGLIEIPPVSKVTPFPIKASGCFFDAVSPVHLKIITLAGLTDP